MHARLSVGLLLRHGEFSLVGDSVTDVVSGGGHEVGQRGHLELLALLPLGRLAHPERQVHHRAGARRRGRGLGVGNMLRGQPEFGQPARVRAHPASDLPLCRDHVPSSRARVVISDPAGHPTGRQEDRQVGEVDDAHRGFHGPAHGPGRGHPRVLFLRAAQPRDVGVRARLHVRPRPRPRPRPRDRTQDPGSALLGLYAPVLPLAVGRHHFGSLGLVGQNAGLVARGVHALLLEQQRHERLAVQRHEHGINVEVRDRQFGLVPAKTGATVPRVMTERLFLDDKQTKNDGNVKTSGGLKRAKVPSGTSWRTCQEQYRCNCYLICALS